VRLLESAYSPFEESLHLCITGFVAAQQNRQSRAYDARAGQSCGAVTRPEMLSLNTSPALFWPVALS